MNQRIKLTFCFLFLLNTIVFGQGIDFEFMTIKEALLKAKKENKIIFLHNGEHCGYGQRSIKVLEASAEAGTFFNQNFINIRPKKEYEIDAIFSVTDSPRYFFINPDGNIVMMISTIRKPAKLIKLGKKVLQGKIIKPNLLMYTNKMYPKSKKTLKMLSSTLQAHLAFNFPKNIDYAVVDNKFIDKINNPDLGVINSKLQESYSNGEYYYNQFLMVLIHELNGEKQKSRNLAKKILAQYPHMEWKKSRILTDNILLYLMEND